MLRVSAKRCYGIKKQIDPFHIYPTSYRIQSTIIIQYQILTQTC